MLVFPVPSAYLNTIFAPFHLSDTPVVCFMRLAAWRPASSAAPALQPPGVAARRRQKRPFLGPEGGTEMLLQTDALP